MSDFPDMQCEINRQRDRISELERALCPHGSDMVCPFCGEADFDKEGLKGHLMQHCQEYDRIVPRAGLFG